MSVSKVTVWLLTAIKSIPNEYENRSHTVWVTWTGLFACVLYFMSP